MARTLAYDTRSKRPHRIALRVERVGAGIRRWAALFSAVAPLAVTASVLLSTKDLARGPVVCPLRLATGIPCPFCGMTTSFAHMGGLRLKDAFLANPGGPLLFAAIVLAGAAAFTVSVTGKRPAIRLPSSRWMAPVIWSSAAVIVAIMWVAQLLRFGIV